MTDTAQAPYAANDTLPEWVRDWIRVCIEALGLGHYQIQAQMHDVPGGDSESACVVELDERYRRALIQIGRFVENNERGRRYILHEMLHVALSPVDRLAQVTLALLPKSERKVFKMRFDDAQETSIETLTRSLEPVLMEWSRVRQNHDA